jgi:hypothetical protein
LALRFYAAKIPAYYLCLKILFLFLLFQQQKRKGKRMRRIIWQARCLHMVVTEELEELNRRTDVSKWLLKRVMLNDPDPAEEEECESSPLGIVTMLKAAVAATALWAMMSAIIIILG